MLIISILRSASLRHSSNFNLPPNFTYYDKGLPAGYYFASAGGVLPDSPFWPIKVFRDKIWLFLTPTLTQKSELNLLFSDKRLMAAKILLGNGKLELAYTTLVKSQSYFEESQRLEKEAREKGYNTDELLLLLNKASLSHKELIGMMMENFPENIKAEIYPIIDSLDRFYNESSSYLRSRNIISQ